MTEQDPKFPRNSQRLRTLKGARIEIDKASSFDVVIRDLSENGAKLKLATAFAVPDRFVLLIPNPNTGQTERRTCERRWQRGEQVGARFVESTADQPGTPPPGTPPRPSLRRLKPEA